MNQGLFDFPSGLLLGNGKLKVQEFLTSGVWVKPASVETVYVFLVGGGGGGGCVYANGKYGSGGGGGGEVVKKIVKANGNLTVSIGSGGLGATVYTDPSSNGGQSSVTDGTTTVTSLGGCGGANGNNTVYPTALGANGGGAGNGMGVGTAASSGGAGSGGVQDMVFSNAVSDIIIYRSKSSAKHNIANPMVAPSLYIQGYEHGGNGIDGFAGGGAGGTSTDGGTTYYSGIAPCGAGLCGIDAIGGDATANTGSGGGGVITPTLSTSTNIRGGNGGSGYCLIAWTE